MVETLSEDHEDMATAAEAALDTALSIIEERAKFAVVGQVTRTPEHGTIPPDHEAAVKVCLGFYPTDTQAIDAAGELAVNTSARDELRTWVVPTFFGTPSGWHAERRAYYAGLEAKAQEKKRDRIRASIEKSRVEAQERADRIRAMEEAADQPWPCYARRVAQDECRHEPRCK